MLTIVVEGVDPRTGGLHCLLRLRTEVDGQEHRHYDAYVLFRLAPSSFSSTFSSG